MAKDNRKVHLPADVYQFADWDKRTKCGRRINDRTLVEWERSIEGLDVETGCESCKNMYDFGTICRRF